MGSVPIPRIKVNTIIDTMVKFDANIETNVDIDAKCERTLTFVCAFEYDAKDGFHGNNLQCSHLTSAFASNVKIGFRPSLHCNVKL